MGMPIGSMKSVISQNDERAICRFRVADTQLGRDAVKLMQAGALRKSIGFRPMQFKAIGFTKSAEGKDEPTGFEIFKSLCLEASAVSIPPMPGGLMFFPCSRSKLMRFERSSDKGSLKQKLPSNGPRLFTIRVSVAVAGWTPETKHTVEVVVKTAEQAKPIEGMAAVVSTLKPLTKEFDAGDIKQKMYGMDPYMPGSMEHKTWKVSKAVDKKMESIASPVGLPIAAFWRRLTTR